MLIEFGGDGQIYQKMSTNAPPTLYGLDAVNQNFLLSHAFVTAC